METGNALDTLVEDIQRLRHIITKRYEDLPYFMLGVDLGSLVLLKYAVCMETILMA